MFYKLQVENNRITQTNLNLGINAVTCIVDYRTCYENCTTADSDKVKLE